MRKPTRIMLILALLAIAISAVAVVHAQGRRRAISRSTSRSRPTGAVRTTTRAATGAPAPTAGALTFDSLELRLRSDKTQYVLGEPIVLYVSLRNTGSTAATVMDLLEPESMYVQYFVTSPGSNTQNKFEPYVLECSDRGPVQLAPGEMIATSVKLFYGQKGWVFTEVGNYSVLAKYLSRVTSNLLRIRVVRGASADDRAASQLIMDSDEAQKFMYFGGGAHLNQGRATLEQVSDRHGGSKLAPYADFSLGQGLSDDFANFSTMTLQKANPGQANGFLNKAKGNLPENLFVKTGVLGLLSTNHRALGNTSQADANKQQLRNMVNGLGSTMKPFSNSLLLRHNAKGQLNLQIQTPGVRQPRNLQLRGRDR